MRVEATDTLVTKINSLVAMQLNKVILRDIEQKPNSKILNLDKVTLDEIKDYILSKHSTEWARRSVLSDDGLEAASLWFKDELDKFYAFVGRDSIR